MWVVIALAAIAAGVIIPLTAILTDAKSKNKKLELQRLEKEIELEQLRLQTYEVETEKMRLELEHSKQHLIEMKNQ